MLLSNSSYVTSSNRISQTVCLQPEEAAAHSVAAHFSSYRRLLAITAALLGLFAHTAILFHFGNASRGPLLSETIQLLLGIGATWAAASAARRSEAYAWKVWWLTAFALGIYAMGQGLIIYYQAILHAPVLTPWMSAPILFFWVTPLAIAGMIDRSSERSDFDWAQILDFSQVVLVGLALHVSVFALSSLWQSEGRELQFLKWQIRTLRDAIILVVLFSRVAFSAYAKTRSFFLRIGIFFLAYALADVIYLYLQATTDTRVNAWLNLLWTFPRIILIVAAVTWEDEPQVAAPRSGRSLALQGHLASVLGPLMVGVVALRINPESPVMATVLIALSFGCSSIRFLITLDRQERATAELRSSRNLFEAVVEGSTEAIYVRDLTGHYLFANPAARRVLGVKEDKDIIGRSNRDFYNEEGCKTTRESDLEIIRSGKPHSTDMSLELHGRTFCFLARKGPYRDADGKTIGVFGISVDVTERRKMEEELRKAQRMEAIGTLAAGVAHDFNNLLTVIKGYTHLLLEQTAGTPANDDLNEIDKAANRAASLTSQLLAFSRKQVMQARVLSLNQVVRDMEKLLRRLIGEDIEFSVQLSRETNAVLADPGQIEQVIMNLAVNARDAMPVGGKLTISTENVELDEAYSSKHVDVPPGHYVLLTVRDTGTGMDPKTQARIFEPFFTTKPTGKGTGLGLSTVYGITSQTGGHVLVESELGLGSCFKIYFPVIDAVPDLEHGQKTKVRPEKGSETILVAEDDANLAALVETSLRRKGYNVLVAGTGEEAEAISHRHMGPIHLLLTDVVMPRTNAREVAQRISFARAETRVLWMSGYTDDTIVHHGMLEEGIDFLAKPFTPSSLADKVREVLDKV
jgi:PAS domain S-box-containing protein